MRPLRTNSPGAAGSGPAPPFRLRRVIVHWLPVVAWMGLIFSLSAQPDLPHAPGAFWDHVVKKSGHIAAFAILAWLWWRALHRERGMPMTAALAVALVIAVLYAVSDEVHQGFVPGRKPRVSDVVFDSLGASAAVITTRLVLGSKAIDLPSAGEHTGRERESAEV